MLSTRFVVIVNTRDGNYCSLDTRLGLSTNTNILVLLFSIEEHSKDENPLQTEFNCLDSVDRRFDPDFGKSLFRAKKPS